jgi:hypothetical protein
MTSDQAQSAVSGAAVMVAGVYAYRRLVEPATKTPPAPIAHFVIGFGVTFIVLALLAQSAPALGGMMAILIAVGDLLVNGTTLTRDLTGALNATAKG